MDINKEREAFETWLFSTEKFKFRNKNFLFMLDEYGSYEDKPVLEHWETWQAAKAQAVPEWISVKNELPPENILVLGMSQTRSNIFNFYDVMALDEFDEADITHWMPLPDAPQEPANEL